MYATHPTTVHHAPGWLGPMLVVLAAIVLAGLALFLMLGPDRALSFEMLSRHHAQLVAWVDGHRSIMFQVQRQPGTNTVEVVDGIRKLLPEFRAVIPASVNIEILYDRSESIRDSIHDVNFTLILSIVLVVGVILVFLCNFRATMVTALVLPASILGTFAVMHMIGFSLNNLSLMALTLCVGFVVDDAIVMLENISRHMEMGKTALQATLDGSREIAFTILSMTLSLAAVFIPVLFIVVFIMRLALFT